MPLLGLFLLFLVLPVAELYLILKVGDAIGIPWTLFLLVADSVLGAGLRPSDLAAPVVGARRAAIDGLVRRRIVRRGSSVLHLRLIRADGTVTYSTDHAEIGKPSGERARMAEDRQQRFVLPPRSTYLKWCQRCSSTLLTMFRKRCLL